jgi:membrane fusion protein
MFRLEALVHAGSRRHGEILLARPPSYALLTGLFGVVACSIVVFFACFSYTRKVQVPGVLLPSEGLIRLAAMQGGVVVERSVAEGATVAADDILFVLSSERAQAEPGNAEQTISRLLGSRRDSLVAERDHLRRQAGQRVAAANRRIRDLSDSIVQLDEQARRQRRRVEIAEEAVARQVDLQKAGFVSAAQVQDRQGDLIDQQQRVADLLRLQASAARELAAARADLDEAETQALRDQAAAQRGISILEQELAENEARRRIYVRAPQGGTVTAITAERGQTIAASQTLASIVPQGSTLEAELYAPSRSAGFLRTGMPVLIRYQAYAYQKFGQARGLVKEVARTALQADELRFPGASRMGGAMAEPVYRVRVTLERQTVTAYGDGQALRPGELLDASVLLESRRLYEWVLEPLYTITGRV